MKPLSRLSSRTWSFRDKLLSPSVPQILNRQIAKFQQKGIESLQESTPTVGQHVQKRRFPSHIVKWTTSLQQKRESLTDDPTTEPQHRRKQIGSSHPRK